MYLHDGAAEMTLSQALKSPGLEKDFDKGIVNEGARIREQYWKTQDRIHYLQQQVVTPEVQEELDALFLVENRSREEDCRLLREKHGSVQFTLDGAEFNVIATRKNLDEILKRVQVYRKWMKFPSNVQRKKRRARSVPKPTGKYLAHTDMAYIVPRGFRDPKNLEVGNFAWKWHGDGWLVEQSQGFMVRSTTDPAGLRNATGNRPPQFPEPGLAAWIQDNALLTSWIPAEVAGVTRVSLPGYTQAYTCAWIFGAGRHFHVQLRFVDLVEALYPGVEVRVTEPPALVLGEDQPVEVDPGYVGFFHAGELVALCVPVFNKHGDHGQGEFYWTPDYFPELVARRRVLRGETTC